MDRPQALKQKILAQQKAAEDAKTSKTLQSAATPLPPPSPEAGRMNVKSGIATMLAG